MDIYANARDYLMDLPFIQSWPELQVILKAFTLKKPRDWMLPVLACEAAGGELERAIPAVAAIACMQASIILIDDMLDADPRGEYRRLGMPETANLAAAFQAAGLNAILQSEAKPMVKQAVLESLVEMAATTALGQHLDVQNPAREEDYWQLVRTKSSPFFGTALQVGALLGGASRALAIQLKQFGLLYGEIIQIHDDLNDVMATPANPDWVQGRYPLPILFTMVVDHPGREQFQELRTRVSDPAVLQEAQTLLLSNGAVSYCIYQILQRYREAKQTLSGTQLVYQGGLEGLLENVIVPVRRLFETMGAGDVEEILNDFQDELL